MEILFGKYFKIALVSLIFIEIISFLGYQEPLVGQLFFGVVVLIALFLSLEKIEYGVYIILAELFTGNKGYLLSLELGGLKLSIRIALFLVLISVWLAKGAIYYIKNNNLGPYLKIKNSQFLIFYLAVFFFIILAILNGFWRLNEFNNIFFDANGWLYFLLVFVFFDAIYSREQIENILQVLLASVVIICLKSLYLLFAFSHQLIESIILYRWTQDNSLAEISDMGYGFYRIFFQSQIYLLIFLVLTFFYLIQNLKEKSLSTFLKKNLSFIFLNIIALSVVIFSLSRSFWVGLISGAIAVLWVLVFHLKERPIFLLRIIAVYFLIVLASIFLIFGIVKFPYPKTTGISLSGVFGDRTTDLSDAAAQSRWNLAGPLWVEIKDGFILGKGFGKTITYQSQDPRQLEKGQGIYTTYAFEWGYLDIWLKLGFFGLAFYLILIYKIWQSGWLKLRQSQSDQFKRPLILGLLLGIIIIISTSIFSPYLNHPLGIGYLIFVSAVFAAI